MKLKAYRKNEFGEADVYGDPVYILQFISEKGSHAWSEAVAICRIDRGHLYAYPIRELVLAEDENVAHSQNSTR